MVYRPRKSIGFLVLLAAMAPSIGRAQSGAAARCSYAECALSIAPTWNGLAMVRGVDGERVANLNFFWPRDVSRAMVGSDAAATGLDSAIAEGRRAVRIRRIAATLTDAGIVLATTAAVRAINAGSFRRSNGVIAGAAAASLGLSIPFQFAADGALSRAVWWHNLRYSR